MYGVSQVTEITPCLYLTSVYGATRENIIKKGTTLLINSAQELPKQEIAGVESIKLFLDDTPFALINVYFDRMADKINEHLNRGGRAMVHCVMGVSRSTSLVLAYLMKYKHMTLKQSYELVSNRRPCVRPNPGFWRQLVDYEKRLTSATNRNEAPPSKYSSSIQIPITIESTSSSSSSNQPERQSLINTFAANSNGYSDFSRPYSASRLVAGGATVRSSSTSNSNANNSSSNNYSDFNSRSSNNYSSYVSPSSQHRTSSLISSPASKYIKPTSFSTTYRSSYGRY